MQKPKDSLETFKQLLNRKGLKYTHERESIFEEVRHLNQHFSADGLYDRFKKRGDRIARATVYRVLPLLLESGVIQKSTGKGKHDFYEKTGSKGHHDHMVCLGCKKVIEFHDESLEILQEKITKVYEFELIFHDHRLFGYCKSCVMKGKK